MGRLNSKVAIITGGAMGIGKETARLFLKEGAKVVLVDLSEESLSKAKQELNSLGEVITVQANVSEEEDVKNFVNTTVEKFGRIDVLFNNAGVSGSSVSTIEQTVEEFDKVINVNLKGVFLGLKHVLPVMIKQASGSIINNSSVGGLMGSPGTSLYSASKHGVVGLTKTAALEVADKSVRVNSIHPTAVSTQMMRNIEANINPDDPESAKEYFGESIPLKRYGEPDDIAKLVLFLASDDSEFITGAQYRIDGGVGAGV